MDRRLAESNAPGRERVVLRVAAVIQISGRYALRCDRVSSKEAGGGEKERIARREIKDKKRTSGKADG